jgi:hypothetical protein
LQSARVICFFFTPPVFSSRGRVFSDVTPSTSSVTASRLGIRSCWSPDPIQCHAFGWDWHPTPNFTHFTSGTHLCGYHQSGKRNFPADYGLNYHGVTIVQDGGAALLRDICLSWCTLFSLAPQTFQLIGAYPHSSSERIEEGGYEKIRCDRTELTKLLKDLINLADRALTDGYCILHIGI